jgi:hypothetical protein
VQAGQGEAAEAASGSDRPRRGAHSQSAAKTDVKPWFEPSKANAQTHCAPFRLHDALSRTTRLAIGRRRLAALAAALRATNETELVPNSGSETETTTPALLRNLQRYARSACDKNRGESRFEPTHIGASRLESARIRGERAEAAPRARAAKGNGGLVCFCRYTSPLRARAWSTNHCKQWREQARKTPQ